MNIDSNIIELIKILITVVIAFITASLTNKNERKKQATIFFKQEGIKQQQAILEFWCSILLMNYEDTIKKFKEANKERLITEYNLKNSQDITDTMAINLLQRDSYMYSSKLTVKYIAKYMQEVFKSDDSKKSNITKQMYLVGKIISSMKNDFTGEKVKVLDLLKIKLNDLDWKKKVAIYYYEFLNLIKMI